jgi:hypothetical protein
MRIIINIITGRAAFVRALAVVPLLGLGACSSDAPSAMDLRIVASPREAVAGDAVTLSVVRTMEDGSTEPLPSAAKVAWSGPAVVTALAPGSTADSPLPAPGAQPLAVFLDNPGRPDRAADLARVLFVLDAGSAGGTVPVTAEISGLASPGRATIAITVAATPDGDATRGAALYGSAGANCAACHGESGHGSPPAADGTTYLLAGMSYDLPAPGLNAEMGNVGEDPDWNAALFAVSSRGDIDNAGVTLQLPMPDWLTAVNPATMRALTTQDFADIYAFLRTQTQ